MHVGDIVRMSAIRARYRYDGDKKPGVSEVNYSAPKGQFFVVLLLGTEPRDGSRPFDPNDALRALGWKEPK